MDKTTATVRTGMRPNIEISYTLNGRVKDYAKEQELELTEAYKRIIERGLAELEEEQNGN